MTETAGFQIDGRTYEVPALGTFTMDEAQILYDYSGLLIEDFAANEEGFSDRIRNPGLYKALLHVAYVRGNPKASTREVAAVVGALKYWDVLQNWADAINSREADAVPLDETKPPSEQSQNASDGSSSTSGADSSATSAPPASTREVIGIGV